MHIVRRLAVGAVLGAGIALAVTGCGGSGLSTGAPAATSAPVAPAVSVAPVAPLGEASFYAAVNSVDSTAIRDANSGTATALSIGTGICRDIAAGDTAGGVQDDEVGVIQDDLPLLTIPQLQEIMQAGVNNFCPQYGSIYAGFLTDWADGNV